MLANMALHLVFFVCIRYSVLRVKFLLFSRKAFDVPKLCLLDALEFYIHVPYSVPRAGIGKGVVRADLSTHNQIKVPYP